MKVNLIIPIYNEAKTVANVIDVALASELFDRVICVDDGSSDRTPEILASYGDRITVVNYGENRGKSDALVAGIEEADGDAVFFLDADLTGLTVQNLEDALAPFLSGDYEVVLAPMHDQMLSLSDAKLGASVCGNRVYHRKDLLPILDRMRGKGFGIEMFLTNEFRNKPTAVVPLRGVSHLYKTQKGWTPDRVMAEMWKEGYELANELVKSKTEEYRQRFRARWMTLIEETESRLPMGRDKESS